MKNLTFYKNKGKSTTRQDWLVNFFFEEQNCSQKAPSPHTHTQ